jgi:hypothetical protein
MEKLIQLLIELDLGVRRGNNQKLIFTDWLEKFSTPSLYKLLPHLSLVQYGCIVTVPIEGAS